MQSLFDGESFEPVELSPGQEQRAAHKREVDRLRQQRHRARKREDKAGSVTVAGASVTLDKVSRDAPEMSRFEQSKAGQTVRDTPELRLLLDTFSELANSGEETTRSDIERALDRRAKTEGVQIFHAGRFLESAFERGALPQFEGVEWVKVPRELLALLLEPEATPAPK